MTKMTKLVQADLQQWQITPVGAKAIAASLQTHPRIKSLKMHYCKLGWEGTEYIARACAQHKTLTNLDLGDNGMDEQGARHIAAMLATNTSITRLDLSKNEGLVDNDDVKAWFLGEVEKIMQTRVTPLNLIIENSPGQKWHPNDRPPPPVREEVDLNKVSEFRLKAAKLEMDVGFSESLKRPGDEGNEYDKQVDFEPAGDSDGSWDD